MKLISTNNILFAFLFLFTVCFGLNGQDRALVPVPDNYHTTEGTNLVVDAPGLLTNDYHLEGLEIHVNSAKGLQHGELPTFVTSGRFTYKPDSGFSGVDTFFYSIGDEENKTSVFVPVIINVFPDPNRPPVGLPDYYATFMDSLLIVDEPGLRINDYDPDGDLVILNNAKSPENGTYEALVTSGKFHYQPDSGFTGKELLHYTIRDELGLKTDSIPFEIEVLEPDDGIPVAVPDHYGVEFDQELIVMAPGILINDIDPENDPVYTNNFVAPLNGTISSFNEDGSFSYKPNAGFAGIDSFSYRITDYNDNFSEFTTVILEIIPDPTRPATPVEDVYGTGKNSILNITDNGMLYNDFNPDDAFFSINFGDLPKHGQVRNLGFGGSFIYTPDPGFVGIDTFTYYLLTMRTRETKEARVVIYTGRGYLAQIRRYVDNTHPEATNINNDCTDPDRPCESVNHAITEAEEGDSLFIGPSHYTESLLIHKSLTLVGSGQDTLTGTVIQAHADSGMANRRVIYVTEGNELTLSDMTIRHGHVSGGGETGRGGGIRTLEAKLILNNVTIEKCKAVYGGGIHNSFSTGKYNNATFRNNYAVQGSANNQGTGGGVYNFESSLEMNNVTFVNNKADRYGGGIRNTSKSSTSLVNSVFKSNSGMWGGGIYNNGESSSSFFETEFIGNSAEENGGGIFNINSDLLLNAFDMKNNSAINGGGLFVETSNIVNISNGIIEGNIADNEGGGLYNDRSETDIINSIIQKNEAQEGGGMFNNGSSQKIVNSIFYLNTAGSGGGLYNFNGSFPHILNSDFSGNISTEGAGGALVNTAMSGLLIQNCILWGNTSAENTGNEIQNSPASFVTVISSIVRDREGDIGDTNMGVEMDSLSFSEDPLFADPENGDLRLLKGSPAINRGTFPENLSIYPFESSSEIPLDLSFNSRIVDEIIDMGAYEFSDVTGLPDAGHIDKDNNVLLMNYPNPYSDVTNIRYQVPNPGHIILEIFNLHGAHIRTLVNEQKPVGEYELEFDGTGLPSGIYLIRLIVKPDKIQYRKMILVH